MTTNHANTRNASLSQTTAQSPNVPASAKGEQMQSVTAYKAFNTDFTCRGFQFEIGKTFEHVGDVIACQSGFHACENPLDVLRYYSPATSRFALITATGAIARHTDDSKIAAARITIDTEIHLGDLIARAVDWIFSRTEKTGRKHTKKVSGAASATGVCGAASATGWSGAASATGESGAASATGESGAASATGVCGAAMSIGHYGRVMGAKGNALFLVARDNDGNITHACAAIAGVTPGVKAGVWYTLNSDGVAVEVSP